MVARIYMQVAKAAPEDGYQALMTRVVQVDVLDKECEKCDNGSRPGTVVAKIDLR